MIRRSIHEIHVHQARSRRRRTFVGGQFSMSPDALQLRDATHQPVESHPIPRSDR